MNGVLRKLGFVLAVGWSVFQLGVGLTIGLPDFIFLPIHLAFALVVTFALVPLTQGMGKDEEIVARSRHQPSVCT